MKKKLSLTDLEVQSFPTTPIMGGMNAVDIEPWDTKYSGVCTCLMFCNSEPRLNCTKETCPEPVTDDRNC